MSSNNHGREDEFLFENEMRSSWRKKAIRIHNYPQECSISIPADFERRDRQIFNISIWMFMALIGIISLSLIFFSSRNSQFSKIEPNEKIGITIGEYSELVMGVISKLSKIKD